MTKDQDPRIADVLREGAPPERDPLFRVAVLDRLEREKYRRNVAALLACAAVVAVIAVIGVSVGGSAREATGAVLIGAALTAAYFIVGPALTQLLARFRG